jgi:hypothetical protein
VAPEEFAGSSTEAQMMMGLPTMFDHFLHRFEARRHRARGESESEDTQKSKEKE